VRRGGVEMRVVGRGEVGIDCGGGQVCRAAAAGEGPRGWGTEEGG
jgi:hypothetical protein